MTLDLPAPWNVLTIWTMIYQAYYTWLSELFIVKLFVELWLPWEWCNLHTLLEGLHGKNKSYVRDGKGCFHEWALSVPSSASFAFKHAPCIGDSGEPWLLWNPGCSFYLVVWYIPCFQVNEKVRKDKPDRSHSLFAI